MWRLLVFAFVLVMAASSSSAARTDATAAHPCRLISDREVSRVLARTHVEIGGSTCRLHRGTPMVGVITVNPDTRARFAAHRRATAAHGPVTVLRGLGEAAFLYVYPNRPGLSPKHIVYVFQRGHRLLVLSYSASLTASRSRRIAAIVAPRI